VYCALQCESWCKYVLVSSNINNLITFKPNFYDLNMVLRDSICVRVTASHHCKLDADSVTLPQMTRRRRMQFQSPLALRTSGAQNYQRLSRTTSLRFAFHDWQRLQRLKYPRCVNIIPFLSDRFRHEQDLITLNFVVFKFFDITQCNELKSFLCNAQPHLEKLLCNIVYILINDPDSIW